MIFDRDYQNKRVSADEAVAMVSSGDWVDYGAFCTAPECLDAALARRSGELSGVKVRALAFPGIPAVSLAGMERESFTYNSWHFSGGERKLHDQGGCHFIPFVYHEGPSHYRQNIETDFCMVRTTPMDEFGNFNFGIGNSFQRAIVERAKKVIVEVNENMPRCLGGAQESVHISEVDAIVESDNRPLLTLPDVSVTDIDRTIASSIVSEIEDGACIQLGIGGMPNAVGKMIAESDLKNLGVHTEMLADAYLGMFEAGKITNTCKAQDKGKMVYAFALGSQRLYDFLDNNPFCASYPVDYTNDLNRIAANTKMISINNALEVDLYGQVSSESSGFRHITGTGGQFDFAYGAYHSLGGKSFICLSSTTKDKEGNLISRIRPTFTPGTIVTLPRAITHYVVTEYGMVCLKGLSTWERAEALISVAHPMFRDDLVKEAESMRIWCAANRNDDVLHMVGACA
ncbi:MAG: 4-hydroxybutyrate CoA-transferase [Desulfobacterales bacterium]|nr:4-hydroxybutyrate CoA-transferase [Desulfobacterales bacterium]